MLESNYHHYYLIKAFQNLFLRQWVNMAEAQLCVYFGLCAISKHELKLHNKGSLKGPGVAAASLSFPF